MTQQNIELTRLTFINLDLKEYINLLNLILPWTVLKLRASTLKYAAKLCIKRCRSYVKANITCYDFSTGIFIDNKTPSNVLRNHEGNFSWHFKLLFGLSGNHLD